MTSHLQLRESVLRANNEILRAGLVVLTFGNVSGVDRAAGVMAIKPSGVPYAELTPESMVLVDLDAGEVVDSARSPSSDTPTHLVLYRSFESIGAIVHTHSTHATAWAQARREIPCFGTTHADHFRGAVPVARELTPKEIAGAYEQLTGDVIVETLRGRGLDPLEMPATLIPSHGPFAWGANPATAVDNAVALENVAAMAMHTLSINPQAAPIAAELAERHFSRKHGPGAYYGQGGTRT